MMSSTMPLLGIDSAWRSKRTDSVHLARAALHSIPVDSVPVAAFAGPLAGSCFESPPTRMCPLSVPARAVSVRSLSKCLKYLALPTGFEPVFQP